MRTRPLPALLVMLTACSDAHPDLAVNRIDLGPEPERPLFLLASAAAGTPAQTDTLRWADTTSRGDTTFFSRGRVITTVRVLADSQWMRIPSPVIVSGIPFGMIGTWNGTQLEPNAGVFTMTYGSETPATLATRLTTARSQGVRMVVAMTGGARANYLTDGVFDMEKWKARMNAFDTPATKALVAQAVSEGTLIGNTVMDEPFNDGGPGNEENSWGPAGTMSKARVDSMCGYAKAIFPTLPQGVLQDYRLANDSSYKVCEFVTSQYRYAKGPLTEYRDGALALCARDRHACAFALNVLNGGTPVKKVPGQTDYASGDCPLTTTGGRGTYFPNCRMTPLQVLEAGRVLGMAGCFLTGFRHDSAFMAKPENQQAFRDVVATLAAQPARSCIRR